MNLEAINQLFQNQPMVVLFAIIAAGLLFGNITIKGINLGSSGVLFTALLAGHLGYSIPGGVGTLGLVLFVYCVGIGAGGRFFASVAREGATLAKLALVIVVSGGLVTWAGAKLFHVPTDLAVGIFAGALTSTPALAAATEGLQGGSGVSIGYGIAYPFGVIGVVLFVQLLPRILKHDLDKIAAEHEGNQAKEDSVQNILVEVTNQNLFGKKIADSGVANLNACQVSRVYKNNQLMPLSYDDCFSEGQILMLVGRSKEINIAIDYLGHKSHRNILKDVENERQQVLVTDRKIAGKTLRELAPLKTYGVVLTRITRLGLTFVPNASTVIESNDYLTAVGRSEDLNEFRKIVGHRSSAIDATDLLSLSAGMTLGIIAGLIPIGLPGSTPITLGLAGGPLFVSLILGHFGRVGRIYGHIPRPTRLLLQELGLVFFLANAGVKGGGSLAETVAAYGPMLFGLGMLVTIVPLLIAWPIARKLFKLDPLQCLGGICGGMTSTPALGAITAKTDSQVPVVSYVSAYPVALIVMIVIAKILIGALGGA
ncbi:aspartate:alanine exchanger family transporter [Coraliomargarita parva]|uniref:aspartate:alanine exchanger family transporter n=1 Tax=Coraliomargarita parva TaxID=3014050 RepID=UPI0022B4A147|nr:aspartate:alanine exchanger family transporter [Coraliomargarita parva]